MEKYFTLKAQKLGGLWKIFVKLVSEILCIITSKVNGKWLDMFNVNLISCDNQVSSLKLKHSETIPKKNSGLHFI